jgi:DNA helicase II / ATP-dependent DNA helicase PcrA
MSRKDSTSLNIKTLWELAKFKPNDEQRDAILHVDGPLFLTAGPGSGKTRVLLWRTVNLLVFHGVEPGEIFLSTFTEKAAYQLKEGLRTLLGAVTNETGTPYDLTPMYIGTVHSLCQRILSDRKFVPDRHRTRPPQLLDELSQYFHLSKNRTWNQISHAGGLNENANETINGIWNIPSQSKHVAVVNCISVFNRFSEECLDADRVQKKIEKAKEHYEQHGFAREQIELLSDLYREYRASLQLDGGLRLTDFALLQQEAFELLNGNEGTKQVFKHVIVDEYQDTNTIQERIFFHLAGGTNNICVVGDDDQALYRFRGATVENFVEFPERCKAYLGKEPRRISLDINYRSRPSIVDFYTTFMDWVDWRKPGGGSYRVADKNISANREDRDTAVAASTATDPETACAEIAQLTRRLIDEGKVQNSNQIAFLFPSMKYNGEAVQPVQRMKLALEAVGLKVYAPRAGRFLEVDESLDVFGLLLHVLGSPPQGEYRGRDYDHFREWVAIAETRAKALMMRDQLMKRYVEDRRNELENSRSDYEALLKVAAKHHWELDAVYDPDKMKRQLLGSNKLSDQAKKLLSSAYLDQLARKRAAGGQPLSLLYILRRVTSIDWNILDLFYRFCGFEHFKRMFDEAENNGDEGPVANLGLITQYLARFLDERISLITADLLVDKTLQIVFFSYLYSLYRLGETEFEDAEDPFPKGRIPFLTIHQSKGLEFPIVVLGNPRKRDMGPGMIEKIVHPLLERPQGEPLDRMSEFDIMRMFYVALSRAKNLLVIAHFKGKGQSMNKPFKALLNDDFPRIPDLDLGTLPNADLNEESLPKSYSFTSDFLLYKKCPRQYMIFRKFNFVPSRSQTMFFGSLVHRTLEDLHHELIRRKATA